MSTKRRFSDEVLDTIRRSKIIGIRAGRQTHRFIGVWAVVVERRVFVRSWAVSADGWYHAFADDPRGAVLVDEQNLPIRAVRTKSERLKNAVDGAYREKYNTPGALKYVRDLTRAKSRATTTELVPL